MSSILKLTVENFQSHEKTILEPAAEGQLTVVVGPSDSGKTAIIRALRWLLYNTPQGDDFIRVGCTLCRVTLELACGHKIIRERTRGGVNRYKILAPGAEKPETYEGFGHTVPLEVRELTGVQPVTIGDLTLNLNMSEQLEGPFLGSSISGGARARILGKLAGTEEVDHAAKLLGTDLYRVRQDEKRLSGEIGELDEKISKYDYLMVMSARIGALETHCGIVKDAQEQRNKVVNLKRSLALVDEQIAGVYKVVERWKCVEGAHREVQRATEAAKNFREMIILQQSLMTVDTTVDKAMASLDRLSGVPEAEELLDGSLQAITQLNTLRQRKDHIRQLNFYLENYQGIVARYRQIDTDRIVEIEHLRQKHNSIYGLSVRLRTVSESLTHKQRQAAYWEHQVSEYESLYRDALLSEGQCPTCGNEVTPERLKEVV